MLQWFVDSKVADAVTKNSDILINEEEVEVRPEKLPDAVSDQNVDVHLIRRFFSQDAWQLVVDVTKQKNDNPVFICGHCSHDADEGPSVLCDHCLSWFHMKCVGLSRAPKLKNWFCRKCHQ